MPHLLEWIETAIVLGVVIATILGYRKHAMQELEREAVNKAVARELVPPIGLGTHGEIKPEMLQNGHIRLWDRIDSIDERLGGMDARFRGIDERMANAERDRQLLVQSTNDTNTMVRKLSTRRRADREADST